MASGKLRVLLADDTDDIRMLLRVTFEVDGRFTVVGEAADGRQAVDLCAELAPDAILLDLRMPEMTGDEALPLLRENCPEAAIVVYTAHVADADIDALCDAGATDVVSKSIPPSAVVQRVAEAIGRP